MLILRVFLESSLAISWLYYLLCLESARHWAKGRPSNDLTTRALGVQRSHKDSSGETERPSEPSSQPPVTILKPLRGADAEQMENFRSFCRQDHPVYQIVFGALDADDPGLENVMRLQEEFPEADIAIVRGGEVFGANRKVCNLANMAGVARYDLFVLCDSDMRVSADYLAQVTAPFADHAVGVVTCPYRGSLARGLAANLEALGIGADFIPSVIVTARFGAIRFALGSTIAIRRDVLEKIGGFRPLADELADDYLIGNRAAKTGYKVVLSDYVVDDVLGGVSFSNMWTRRLRWARTMRAMQPIPVFFSYLTHGMALALLLLPTTGFAALGWYAVGVTIAVRALTATTIARLYTRDENLPRCLPILPLSDLLAFGLWAMSFLGSSVEWRGEKFHVGKSGKLRRL